MVKDTNLTRRSSHFNSDMEPDSLRRLRRLLLLRDCQQGQLGNFFGTALLLADREGFQLLAFLRASLRLGLRLLFDHCL